MKINICRKNNAFIALLTLTLALTLYFLIGLPFFAWSETYKWVDEKGTLHFADDLSNVPEKHRLNAEIQEGLRETPPGAGKGTPAPSSPPSHGQKAPEAAGFEVNLLRRHELLLAEVILNGTMKQFFIVDTGASFTLINRGVAKDLNIVVDENTPYLPMVTVSDVILTPLVTLKSVQVGNVQMENVDALIYSMPSGSAGLLGNSFLNKFKVMLDSVNGRMTLFPLEGVPAHDRPGGYGKDYWQGQFQFYHRTLEELEKVRARYGSRGGVSDLNRVRNAIRHFESQLHELDRKASSAGVPRSWRE